MTVAIGCTNVGKKFSKSLNRSTLYGALDILGSAIGRMPDPTLLRPGEFWALHNVDFELQAGESLGIVGHNGSGKTTLLKLLNGIFMPDQGRITMQGRVVALIQVGAGFHPMLSGRENIYVNGTILGLTKKEIDRNFDSIVDFADIGDFLDAPVKFYSSGMYVRLGFAIAIHCRPDILLIDEILAVGDLKFHTKCLKFIHDKILKNGCTVVFVSHNRYDIEDVCQKALYLKKGQMAKTGKTVDVLGAYLDDIKTGQTDPPAQAGLGPEGITKVLFLDKDHQIQSQFKSGEPVKIRFFYSFRQAVRLPSVAITLIHSDPRYTVVSSTDYIFNLHSGYDGFQISSLEGDGYLEVSVDCLYLPIGIYQCLVYLFSDSPMNLVSKYEDAARVEVLWTNHGPQRSLIDLPHHWSLKEAVKP